MTPCASWPRSIRSSACGDVRYRVPRRQRALPGDAAAERAYCTTRSVLVELAARKVFRLLWSEEVHQEWMRNLAARNPQIPLARIARMRALMEAHVKDGMVTGHEPLISMLTLPNPDDWHVLAAAIHGGACVIVTSNLRDFPAAALAPFKITALDADSFVLQLITADVDKVVTALAFDRADLVKPPLDANAYLNALEHGGLVATAEALRPMANRLPRSAARSV